MTGWGQCLRIVPLVVAAFLQAAEWTPCRGADDSDPPDISDQGFASGIQPLLSRYCFDCHSADLAEADLDLSEFTTLADIQSHTDVWLKIRDMLDSGQMPPRDADQPSDEEAKRLRQWVRAMLTEEARRHAGDPGPTILRRLNNEEYNYTIRDLTGVDSLDPTSQFPVDGAAGEGFINSGAAQAMSPALVGKYFDAARDVAGHLVLLPDGITFSPHTSRRDQTDECLRRIQSFYHQFTVEAGSQPVQLAGFPTDRSFGGVLPLQQYLLATLEERTALTSGTRTPTEVARDRGLNPKYLTSLWTMLTTPDDPPSFLLNHIRRRWQQTSGDEVTRLTQEITAIQNTLWTFNAVGHIGQDGQPRTWLEPRNPVVPVRSFSIPLTESDTDVTVFLASADAGDGDTDDRVVWQNPRLSGAGVDIPLSRLAGLQEQISRFRTQRLGQTASCLNAVAEFAADANQPPADLAAEHGVDRTLLAAWLRYLGISEPGAVTVSRHFTDKYTSPDYAFVTGWGTPATPSIVSNASDTDVRIPGLAPAHSVLVHPSPTLFVAAGWQSPLTGQVTVRARVADAHPECGNGQEWIVRHRTADTITRLGSGHFGPGGVAELDGRTIDIHRGEVVSLIIGPHEQNHACDLTNISLTIEETAGEQRRWDLVTDIGSSIQAANPHPDSYGHTHTWHLFHGELADLDGDSPPASVVPPDSLLARWLEESDPLLRKQLTRQVQSLVTGPEPDETDSPDAMLYRHVQKLVAPSEQLSTLLADASVDPRFGTADSPDDLLVRAPSVQSFTIPAALAAGRTLVTDGRLPADAVSSGAVRLEVSTSPLAPESISQNSPIVATDGSETRQTVESAFTAFRRFFAPALCYERIVPIDEIVTITLFYRQDDLLQQFMLNDQQTEQLERLWDQLLYVSHEPRLYQVAFEQNRAFATQDRPDLVEQWSPLAEAVEARLAAFEQQLLDSEPLHLQALLEFADRAWRRPLTSTERSGLQEFYTRLRDSELSHDQSVRLTLTRILTSPAFLYRREQPSPGPDAAPVSNQELATRLSYFLWSSMPDATLRQTADSGELTQDDGLLRETHRLLQDSRIRRLAFQFACQWLHLRDFDANDDKNEALYPEFDDLKDDMYEETVLFFEDMFRNNGSILNLLDADHTFLNEDLATHYGVEGITGHQWRRVDRIQSQQRGGLLGMASLLASQSGASRTSPILRGTWISETLLGERLPKPPASVPQLPDTVPEGLTARQLIELHSSAPECAVCHARIDPYGFALEQYDAIGRLRPAIADTSTTLEDGRQIEGIDGLRSYLLNERRDDVVRQFCRKLLGYALGRAVRLSDEPLIDTMQDRLAETDYRFHTAVESVVLSPQFRQVRGLQSAEEASR